MTENENEKTQTENVDQETMEKAISLYLAGFAAGTRSLMVSSAMNVRDEVPMKEILERIEKQVDNIMNGLLNDETAWASIVNAAEGVWLGLEQATGGDFLDNYNIAFVEVNDG